MSPVQIQVPLPYKKRTHVRFHINGPVVKRLRLRPFTAATRVRVPSGSPPFSAVSIWRHSSAGRALASHARGHRFEFCCLHQKSPSKPLGFDGDFFFIQLFDGPAILEYPGYPVHCMKRCGYAVTQPITNFIINF